MKTEGLFVWFVIAAPLVLSSVPEVIVNNPELSAPALLTLILAEPETVVAPAPEWVPVIVKVPPLTVVRPEYEFVPDRICSLVLVLLNAINAVGPSVILPAYVVDPLAAFRVSVFVPLAPLLVMTVPAAPPPSEAKVGVVSWTSRVMPPPESANVNVLPVVTKLVITVSAWLEL